MKSNSIIKKLLAQRENETLELKSKLDLKSIGKEVCALLNHKGGDILIGFDKTKKAIAIPNIEEGAERLNNFLLDKIVPQSPLSVTPQSYNNRDILHVQVWPGSKHPYMFDGKIYMRKGSSSKTATASDITKLIVKRQEAETHWEKQLLPAADINDLDKIEIQKTLEDMGSMGRSKSFKSTEIEEYMTHFGLMINGYITNAAMVLFGIEPQRFIPQSRIRLTVYKTSKGGNDFLYDKLIEGHLFNNLRFIQQFFDVHVNSSSKITNKSTQRVDSPYPKIAIREGLLNAIVHRDYSPISSILHISFYPDKLEIINTGELLEGISLSDLSKNHPSLLRNPLLAHICYVRGYVENLGSGTLRMIADLKDKGFPKPKWNRQSGHTLLTMVGVKASLRSDDTVSDTVSDTVIRILSDTVDDTVNDTVSHTVKKRMIKILKALSMDTSLNATAIAKRMKTSNVTIRRDMQKLSKVVDFIGAPKTGGYHLKKSVMKKINKS